MDGNRQKEVRQLLRLPPQVLQEKAGDRLHICANQDELHLHFARSIAEEIARNNAAGRTTRLVLPVGPTGQYPLLAELINSERITLHNCWFFMMDEHADEFGQVLPCDHPLSFRHALTSLFTSRIARELMIPEDHLIFPDQNNISVLADRIAAVGGIDTTYGGIGIHGHLAYNEPAPGIRDSNPRLVELNDFTRTMNATRSEIGGNLEGYPRRGYTLGMCQLLGAQRVRLYCRNGISLDWANTVLRLAILGQPGDDYPVTYLREHPDYVIVTDAETARSPRFVV